MQGTIDLILFSHLFVDLVEVVHENRSGSDDEEGDENTEQATEPPIFFSVSYVFPENVLRVYVRMNLQSFVDAFDALVDIVGKPHSQSLLDIQGSFLLHEFVRLRVQILALQLNGPILLHCLRQHAQHVSSIGYLLLLVIFFALGIEPSKLSRSPAVTPQQLLLDELFDLFR